MAKALLSQKDAGALIGKSARFLYRRRIEGTGPPVYLVGRTPMYDGDEVLEWAKAEFVEPETDESTEADAS